MVVSTNAPRDCRYQHSAYNWLGLHSLRCLHLNQLALQPGVTWWFPWHEPFLKQLKFFECLYTWQFNCSSTGWNVMFVQTLREIRPDPPSTQASAWEGEKYPSIPANLTWREIPFHPRSHDECDPQDGGSHPNQASKNVSTFSVRLQSMGSPCLQSVMVLQKAGVGWETEQTGGLLMESAGIPSYS